MEDKKNIYSVITGTGSYIPTRRIRNEDFLNNEFYDSDGKKLDKTNSEIVQKFFEITTIEERRYVTDDLVTSDIAYFSSVEAIKDAGIDKEDLDYIVVAHNFGDVKSDNKRSDFVPSLAARVKEKLGIKNPATVAYDLPFGCPGWLQAVIQTDYFLKSGDAKKVLLIGAETLSRVIDPHDRDSMLYSDGAGAVVMEARESPERVGVLAHKSRSDTLDYARMLYMGESYKENGADEMDGREEDEDAIYLKMHGRKLYQYALERVPQAIKDCLEKCSVHLGEVGKVLIHQANGKMDAEILKRLYALYDKVEMPKDIMPMTISYLGNSSVATLPTLLDMLLKGKVEGYGISRGETLVLASVGAGMNINALVYKMP